MTPEKPKPTAVRLQDGSHDGCEISSHYVCPHCRKPFCTSCAPKTPENLLICPNCNAPLIDMTSVEMAFGGNYRAGFSEDSEDVPSKPVARKKIRRTQRPSRTKPKATS